MPDAPWTDGLQPILARIRGTDPADQHAAKGELFAKVYDRLRQLARRMLPGFPLVERSVDATDLAHDLYLGLLKAFAQGHVPADEPGFHKFAAWKLRRMLLDLADAAKVRDIVRSLEQVAGAGSTAGYDHGTTTNDPAKLAEWTRFHGEVANLPDDEREVFELCFYGGLTQAEAASLLGLAPKATSRLYLSAASRLKRFLPAGA